MRNKIMVAALIVTTTIPAPIAYAITNANDIDTVGQTVSVEVPPTAIVYLNADGTIGLVTGNSRDVMVGAELLVVTPDNQFVTWTEQVQP